MVYRYVDSSSIWVRGTVRASPGSFGFAFGICTVCGRVTLNAAAATKTDGSGGSWVRGALRFGGLNARLGLV